jgi:glycosyltransferase involved in cell wall biosynthesis
LHHGAAAGFLFMPPLVSIMIPTYNQEKLIAKAVRSALDQDYPHLEVIVADDASTDGTAQAVAPLLADPRLRYHRNSANLGRVANYRQTLERLVNGQWAVNLDGDDYLIDPAFIREAVQAAGEWTPTNSTPAEVVCVVAGGRIVEIDERGQVLSEIVKLPPFEEYVHPMAGKEWLARYHEINHFFHLAALFRVDRAREVGFYRREMLSTDVDSFLRLALRGEVRFLKRVVGVWLRHQHNASRPATPPSWEANLAWIPECFAGARGLFEPRELRRLRLNFLQHYGAAFFVIATGSRPRPGDVARWASTMLRLDPRLLGSPYFLKRLTRFSGHALRTSLGRRSA